MVVLFALLSVGKEAWLKSTIRWNAWLFSCCSLSTTTKTCSCKVMYYWSNLRDCFPHIGGSVPAPGGHTNCCTFASFLHITFNYFDTSFLVTFWVVVESTLLSSLNKSGCTYSMFIWWATVALPVSVSILNLSLFTMTIVFHMLYHEDIF